MSDERERCLALFGLKPGASAAEIKAAYRDLAKVWHPDRFSHDPRLQEKAQNKLKEINEAYEALTTASYSRNPRASRPSADTTAASAAAATPRPRHNGGGYLWPMLLFIALAVVATFLLFPRLLKRDAEASGQESATVQRDVAEVNATDERDDAATARKDKKGVEKPKAAAETVSANPAETQPPPRPLPTVTVTIDSTTGLLATAACPSKTSMTYPAGREPHQYCGADHRSQVAAEATAPDAKKKSRLKSMLNRTGDAVRWLNDKTKDPAEQDD